MPLSYVLLAVMTAAAAASDLVKYRISNRFFLLFLGAELLLPVLSGESPVWTGMLLNVIFPFILLYIPGCLRVIGAGDVKLFCLISGLTGRGAAARIILVSFLIGGAEALILMLFRGNLIERMGYFLTYLGRCLTERKVLSYMEMEKRDGKAVFHFTVPILLAVLLYLGGVYR